MSFFFDLYLISSGSVIFLDIPTGVCNLILIFLHIINMTGIIDNAR